jgi:glycosyltransferase involved in cell wall biosynthesis
VLDVTRLASRAGRVLTGVDRVELAYLDRLCDGDLPLFAMARTAFGFVLLDRQGARGLLGAVTSDRWDPPSGLSRLAFRRLAIARCRPNGLAQMLAARLPAGSSYVNVGHSNLSRRVFDAMRAVPGTRIAVMLHDTIPLDLPDMQRERSVARFAGLFERVMTHADTVICNSEATRADIQRHAPQGARLPRLVVAHLGVSITEPDPAALPPGLPPDDPYFVALGTIEPRKNIGFLLDLWAGMQTPPTLVLVGARGWRNEAVFARLDRHPAGVIEAGPLSDAAAAALVAGAAGLLMPSLAEGYGLPPIEATALGVPVLCNSLPVYRETLGDIPIYAPVRDEYSWRQSITGLAEARRAGRTARGVPDGFTLPTWDAHFNHVLSEAC